MRRIYTKNPRLPLLFLPYPSLGELAKVLRIVGVCKADAISPSKDDEGFHKRWNGAETTE